MSYPSLYDPKDVYRDFYIPRTADFAAEGLLAGLRPAAQDTRKVAAVLIDMQWDFVHPTGTLSVPNATDDTARSIDWLYRNVEAITTMIASEDTHHEFQIFYPTWWQYQDTGESPNFFTSISLNSLGEAVDQNGRRVLPLIAPKWSLGTYLPTLKANAQKDLMLWPFHCMEGTAGHCLMPALREALAFYAIARRSQVNFMPKGTCPQTEHYSIFGAEVPYPKDPSTGINTVVLDLIGQHDLIYVLGQAKKHCVYESMRMTLMYFKNQPDVIKKLRFVENATSPVPGMPAAFEAATDAEMARWQKMGVQFVKTTDQIG